MASYVIHYLAGERFLTTLKERYNVDFSEDERKKFLLGNLIVDSCKLKKPNLEELEEEEANRIYKEYRLNVQRNKIITHFRGEDDKNLCIQAPKVEKFIDKYNDLIKKDYSALGYLFHLYTDKMFFSDLFTESFDFLDKDGNNTEYLSEVKNIRIKKNNSIAIPEEVFSPRSKNSIYEDYTKMNKLLLDHYDYSFDSNYLKESIDKFINPGIEEVDYGNAEVVINQTNRFINESYNLTNTDLNVFDTEVVKNFIDEVVDSFVSNYEDYLRRPNQEKRLIKK